MRSVGSISIFLNFLTIIANPEKQKAHPNAIKLPKKPPFSSPSFIIINIPNKATIIIKIVLKDSFSFKNIYARPAVMKGIALNVNEVFAIEVFAYA